MRCMQIPGRRPVENAILQLLDWRHQEFSSDVAQMQGPQYFSSTFRPDQLDARPSQ